MKLGTLGKFFAIGLVCAGAIMFAKALLPAERVAKTVSLGDDNGRTIEVELDRPQKLTPGRDETITLRVLPSAATANALFVARAELPYAINPQGEVMEVAGEDGGAVFYWNVSTDRHQQASGRIWLYLAQAPKAVLLGALPVDLAESGISWFVQFAISAMLMLIGALLFARVRV